MKHNCKQIEELIKKELLKQITTEEEALLLLEKARYTEQEYEHMVIEVLRGLGDQLPKRFLQNWEPDYTEILRRGEAIRTESLTLEQDIKGVKRMKVYKIFAVAILFVLAGAAVYYFGRAGSSSLMSEKHNNLYVADVDDIPFEESSCMLLLENSKWITVDKAKFGTIEQIGDLLISRTEEGILRIERRKQQAKISPVIENIEIYTPPRQQCVLEIEDGSRIRMNAQTHVTYPIRKRDTAYIAITGEAYVVAPKKPLRIATYKGLVTVRKGNFMLRADKNATKLMLQIGDLDLYSYEFKKAQKLDCPGDLAVVVAHRTESRSALKDTLYRAKEQDFESTMVWTRKVRNYKNIPLLAFVEEMSRWEGFTIEKWDCLPKGKFVTVSINYKSDTEEVYGAIRDAGVLLYEHKGMISFCPDDEKNTLAGLLLARWED